MAVSDYSSTPSGNTAIGGLPVSAGDMLAKHTDEIVRQMMADIRAFYDGLSAQDYPVGFVEVVRYVVSETPSTIDFIGWNGLFDEVIISGNLTMTTDDQELHMRTAGPDDVFDNGPSDYTWWHNRVGAEAQDFIGESGQRADNADDEIEMFGSFSHSIHGAVAAFNGAGGGCEFWIHLPTLNQAIQQRIMYQMNVGVTDAAVTPALAGHMYVDGGGVRNAAEKLGGVRLFPENGGTFASGQVRVYGRLA